MLGCASASAGCSGCSGLVAVASGRRESDQFLSARKTGPAKHLSPRLSACISGVLHHNCHPLSQPSSPVPRRTSPSSNQHILRPNSSNMLALRSIAAPVQRQCGRAAPRAAAVRLSFQVRPRPWLDPGSADPGLTSHGVFTEPEALLVARPCRQVQRAEGCTGAQRPRPRSIPSLRRASAQPLSPLGLAWKITQASIATTLPTAPQDGQVG